MEYPRDWTRRNAAPTDPLSAIIAQSLRCGEHFAVARDDSSACWSCLRSCVPETLSSGHSRRDCILSSNRSTAGDGAVGRRAVDGRGLSLAFHAASSDARYLALEGRDRGGTPSTPVEATAVRWPAGGLVGVNAVLACACCRTERLKAA